MTSPAQSSTHVARLPDTVTFVMDGKGNARTVDLVGQSGQDAEPAEGVFTWVHLRRDAENTAAWLDGSGLDRVVVEALTAEETRPRCTVFGQGAVVNLRGVNLNPGAEPDDMISVRLWIEERRVVGVWIRPLLAVRDLIDGIERNQAPVSPGQLVARLALRLADRAEPVVGALNERIDTLEETVVDEMPALSRGELADIRRSSIVLRRFMFPQRDALTTLQIEDLPWLGDHDRGRIREAADRVMRLGEELDAIRDRAQVVHDQMSDKRAETMNRHMLVLSVAAAIFLPLGLLTGLLGINVGGIPGADAPLAFAIVCGVLVALGAAQVWFFRRIGLLRWF